MDGGKIVIRYSKAFYELIKENNVVDNVINDIENILLLYNEKNFTNFINNVLIRPSEKFKILGEILSGYINDYTLKFLKLIIENRKESYLKRILIHILDLHNEERKIKKASLISAYPINNEFKLKLNSILKERLNYDFIFEEKIDKKIIGGFVLQIDDLLIDASIKNSLNKIKKELLIRK